MSRPAAVLGGYVYFPLCVSTSGHLCLTGSNGFDGAGCELRLWDVRMRAQIAQFEGHAQVLSPDEEGVVVVDTCHATLRVCESVLLWCRLDGRARAARMPWAYRTM